MWIKFNEIVVDSIESHSGILIGTNFVPGSSSFSKTQQLIGPVGGSNNNFSNSFGLIIDQDVVDTPINVVGVFEHEQEGERPNIDFNQKRYRKIRQTRKNKKERC